METKKSPKRTPLFGAKSFLAMIGLVCGIGIYTGMGFSNETVQADDVEVHVVDKDETVWDIARPIADDQGMDIREIIYQIKINNGLDDECTLRPGQKIIIRY